MALNYEVLYPMVKNVARSVSSNYPSYVTSEDTEGHLWVWVYTKRSTLIKLVEDSPEDWEAKIASTMRKVASDHCAKEKAAAEGYSTDDLYRYSTRKIRSLLPDVFNHVDWQSFGQRGDGQPSAKPQANQTGDRVAELIDVRMAVKSLPEDTKHMLYLVYVYSYTAENIAEHFGIKEDAAKKRLQRSYGAIQRALGRRGMAEAVKRPERRMVRSNAAWRAAQSTQYEG